MPPTRAKKHQSTQSVEGSTDIPSPKRQMVPTKEPIPFRTPEQNSPVKKEANGITAAQKQALMDNLQLEVTERARKLRAQYMHQAQSLRSRIEMRINRIPRSLRDANIGELFLKYSETAASSIQESPKRVGKATSPAKSRVDEIREQSGASPSPQKQKKRPSDDITDKENDNSENPKKKLRGPPPARNTVQSQVLSPRSANLRNQPSRPPTRATATRPTRAAQPKSNLSRTEEIITNIVEKATRGKKPAPPPATAATRGRRTPAPPAVPTKRGRGRPSATSESSEASNGTVIRKPLPKKEPAAKRTVMGTLRGMGGGAANKKTPAAKPSTTITGTRSLRKRN